MKKKNSDGKPEIPEFRWQTLSFGRHVKRRKAYDGCAGSACACGLRFLTWYRPTKAGLMTTTDWWGGKKRAAACPHLPQIAKALRALLSKPLLGVVR